MTSRNADWLARSRASVWHPCTQMKAHETLPLVPLARGEGAWLYDFDGRRYLDAVSSWWVNLFGHAHPALTAAIADQAARLPHAMLAGFTVAVEFRNTTWFNSDKHASRTLAFERENGFVNVVVDEPQGIANTIPAVWQVTNPALAVVRLHGRNHGTWNRKGLASSTQRFDYEYSEDELRRLAHDVQALAVKAASTHVLCNINYQDQGQRAARSLARMLGG